MRNPKRIPKILKEVEKAWEKNPDLRLGQFLLNLFPFYSVDLYYIEDEVLAKKLKEFYEK